MRNRLLGLVAGLALVVAAAIGPASTASAQGDTLINVGSPPAPFSANKQNEPAVAIDANHPNVLAAGSNDNIDMEACNAGDRQRRARSPTGVGVSGVYFSFDCGATWTQPTYTGLTARNCTGVSGPDPSASREVGADRHAARVLRERPRLGR